MIEPNLYLITFAAVAGACGLALVFVGTLMAMLVAFGQKHWCWGVAICVLIVPALIYSGLQRQKSNYAWHLLVAGYALVLLFTVLMYWQLDRLGLDFIEVMRETRPVH